MGSTRSQEIHVVMLPWLAHGHISPFLELAKRLSLRSFHVHICSTQLNLSSIQDQLNRKAYPSIHLIELQLPSLPNLHPQCHTTRSLPPHLMPTLKTAFDLSQTSLTSILTTLNPHLLIYDFLQPWAPASASFLKIPSVLFLPTAAVSIAFFLHAVTRPGASFPFSAVHLSESHEVETVGRLFKSKANNIKDMDRLMQCMDRSNSFILVKSFKEIESKYINYLSTLACKEMVPVGPLVQEAPPPQGHESKFMEWLDKWERSSTVFVSFGSEYFMSKREMEEIAHGLELSRVNFIWVVRFHEGQNMRLEEALPYGFIGRVGDRGMVVEGWAPQAVILGHSSIGGFVSHCGWSSVVEGMHYGVPLIALPLHLDQPLNAKLVVDVGVGVEIKRGRGGEIEREEVARGIRKVLLGREGERVQKKAKEMRDTTRKKGEEEDEVVVEKLRGLCNKTTVEN